MKHVSRRQFLAAGAALSAGALAGASLPIVSQRFKPPVNVILLVADALRADTIGRRLRGRSITPNIDRLADRATVFTNAYSCCSWTKPSMASILTGSYPPYHGVTSEIQTIGPNCDTLARLMGRAGLTTIAVQTNGWLWPERVPGTTRHDKGRGFGAGFDRYRYIPANEGRSEGLAFAEGARVTDSVLACADTFPQGYFIYAHYMDTHQPWLGPGPTRHTGLYSGSRAEVGSQGAYDDNRRAVAELFEDRHAEVSDSLKASIRGIYDEAASYLDDEIGRLLKGLREMGKFHNTVIVFTSDHGEAFWEHGEVTHRNALYQEEIRVPLIIKAPQMGAGTVDSQVSNVNIHRTLADLMESKLQFDVTGSSLADTGSRIAEEGEDIFCQLDNVPVNHSYDELKLVTRKARSLIVRRRGGEIFERRDYDLARDPGEQNPLPAQPDDEAELSLARIERQFREYADANGIGKNATTHRWQLRKVLGTDREGEFTDEERQRLEELKALGYL